MEETIKVPHLARDLKAQNVRLKTADDGVTRLTFSASSDRPLERVFGTELLEHTERAVRLTRINEGAAPLLFNHNWDDPIGMIERGRLVDGRLEVKARLFKTARADEVRAMIDGGMHNVSIGYELHQLRELEDGNGYRAIDWEPYEVSIAPVPADASVGLGRTLSKTTFAVRVLRAEKPTASTADDPTGDKTMSNETEQAVQKSPTVKTEERSAHDFDVQKVERERREAITNLCRAQKFDAAIERHWIESGKNWNEISKEVVQIIEERGKTSEAPALLGMTKTEVRKYSVMRAIQAASSNNWKQAGLEFEAHRALMDRDNLQPKSNKSVFVPMDVQARSPRYGRRDLTAAVAGAAGGVGTDHLAGSFIDLLYNLSVTMGSGATRLSGLRGNVQIPKLTAGATSYWLASETTAITESTPTMGALSLTPKNVAALVEVSHQMAQQGDPSTEQMVLRDLAKSVALAMDVGALSGDGTGGAPTGITNTAGIGAFTGTALDYAAVLDAQSDLVKANTMQLGNLAYVCDPDTTTKLMTRVKFTGTASPIWEGNILEGQVQGIPARTSNQMAANTMLLGAWSSLVIAEWGTLELAVDDKFNFATGSIGLRAWYTVDIGVRHAAAFSLASTIT